MIRSDCGWLILKLGIIQNYIITISCDEKEITDEQKITDKLFKFYKVLFQKKISVSNKLILDYLKKTEFRI